MTDVLLPLFEISNEEMDEIQQRYKDNQPNAWPLYWSGGINNPRLFPLGNCRVTRQGRELYLAIDEVGEENILEITRKVVRGA